METWARLRTSAEWVGTRAALAGTRARATGTRATLVGTRATFAGTRAATVNSIDFARVGSAAARIDLGVAQVLTSAARVNFFPFELAEISR